MLCNLLSTRPAHFASNLGVVELCLALHSVFDFRRDRLIWDTGHQIYPHKLVTGRYREFSAIRTKGGLMGYPNPAESPYDLFMTGHAGCSVSHGAGTDASATSCRAKSDRHAVAVIGDGAFSVGHRVRGDEQRRRHEEEAADDSERQQDVDLPSRRRHGRLSRSAAHQSVLHRPEDRSGAGAEQDARVGRSGRTVSGPAEGGDQGGLARRHAVRGSRVPLHRSDRRPQHRAAAQVPADGPASWTIRCCCTW